MDCEPIKAEFCAICREIFCDPVMAGDGFCYCRNCLGEWVNGRWDWTSPLTNQLHFGFALLTPDLLRAGASLSYHRDQLKHLSALERFRASPYAFFGETPLCTAADCASMLEDAAVLSFVRQAPPFWSCALLDVCWRAKQLGRFPVDCIFAFCAYEKRGDTPFVQREVARSLLEVQASRYKSSPSRRMRAALLECRAHFLWRQQQVDAIFVPGSRVAGGRSLTMVRNAKACPSGLSHTWTDSSGAYLSIPRLHPYRQCLSEVSHCEIKFPPPARDHVFRSQCLVELQGSALWRSRRAPPPARFPDSAGESAESASSESSEATSLASTDSSMADSAADAPPSCSRVSEKLSIFEDVVWALPSGFEYVPRVHCEHEANDAHGTLARVDNILVTEMLNKRNGCGRAPLASQKRRRLL